MEILPIIDINDLRSSESSMRIQNGDKSELINYTSVDLGNQMIDAILSGNVDPLEFLVKKKMIVDALDFACKDASVKDLMLDEVRKHGKEGATRIGAKITIRNTARYEYASDPTWSAIAAEMEPIKERLKAQEEKIKAACKNNCSLIDQESGEIIASVVPCPSAESITVSFSKK